MHIKERPSIHPNFRNYVSKKTDISSKFKIESLDNLLILPKRNLLFFMKDVRYFASHLLK